MIPPRRCPVPRCAAPVDDGRELCLGCWALVSTRMQASMLAAFKLWARGRLSDAAYQDAVWSGVRSCLRARREPQLRTTRRARTRTC